VRVRVCHPSAVCGSCFHATRGNVAIDSIFPILRAGHRPPAGAPRSRAEAEERRRGADEGDGWARRGNRWT